MWVIMPAATEGSQMMRAVFAVLALCAAVSQVHAASVIDDKAVRDFVATQDQAWNARDFDHFYGTFRVNAKIAIASKEGARPRKLRTIGEDKRETLRYFAAHKEKMDETDTIERIVIAPDRRHARVRVRETTRIADDGNVKVLNAIVLEDLALAGGRIVVTRLTEVDQP
jgi:hypothetical protein